MKYVYASLPMALCNEILSVLCLCVIGGFVIYDLFKHAPKNW